MSVEDFLSLGTDLCQLAIATPPKGQVRDFDRPATLKTVIVAITVILTPLSIVFAGGRLHTNIRKLSWGDGMYMYIYME